MSKIRQFLEQVLQMPYYKNYAAASGKVHNIAKHEDATEDLLIQHGFTKHSKGGIPKKQRDDWLKDPYSCTIPDGTYVSQPTGKQDSPDFIVKENGRAYFIECKSVSKKTKAPMYNSGVPKSGYIYVFTAKKYNQTTIYNGSDILSKKDYGLFTEHIKECRARDKEFNEKISSGHNIQFYTRPMISHYGGVDYFTHPSREEIEQRVLNNV
tara:strand:+ start:115 stop:744 length:630 start_codon:yes stop_codon:yes gene_type:complete